MPLRHDCLPRRRGRAACRPIAAPRFAETEIVIVTDLIAMPDAVKLDQRLGARLRNVRQAAPYDIAQQSDDDRKVTAAIGTTLVYGDRRSSASALRSNDPIATTGGNRRIVAARSCQIDEAMRTRRKVSASVPGRSDVKRGRHLFTTPATRGSVLEKLTTADAKAAASPAPPRPWRGRRHRAGSLNLTRGLSDSVAYGPQSGCHRDGESMAKAIDKAVSPRLRQPRLDSAGVRALTGARMMTATSPTIWRFSV